MAEAYLGEIRMFAGIFAPHKWGFCHGTLLAISSNQALYSLLGTTYGGDGRSSFGVPDLRGRIPVGQGSGPGLTTRLTGNSYGTETHVLSASEMPAHTHVMQASTAQANTTNPIGAVPGTVPSGDSYYDTSQDTVGNYFFDTENEGGNAGHKNVMPFLVINYILCLDGIYPSRN